MAVIVSGNDYKRHFDAERYLEYMYAEPEGLGKCNMYAEPEGLGKCNSFVMKELHTVFASGKIKGQTLLDIGTGPAIHTVLSASSNVDEIHLSDYVDQNINILKDWQTGKRSLQNNIIEWVLDLENNKQSVEERTSIMREKVKKIFHIDITSLDSITGSYVPTQYDVITSGWCLDSAGETKEKYIQCVNNIYSLLKPGGYFVLVGDLNASTFRIDDTVFQLAQYKTKELKAIYKKRGFEIETWNECSYKDELCDPCNQSKEFTTFVMSAKRKI